MPAVAKVDFIGAVTAQAIFILCIAVFVVRMVGRPTAEYWLGVLLLLTAFPLVYLAYSAPGFDRPALYYIQIGLMLTYLLAELLLDYVFQVEFRQVRWVVIAYVMLLFAGTGGMIGVAALAGRSWSVSSVVLFLIMAVLAFVQRARTGM